MRHLIIFCCFLLLAPLGAQQTLHVITTINPHANEDIGAGCQVDLENVNKLFAYVEKSLQQRGINMEVKRYTPNFDPESVSALLNGLEVGQDDAVVFLYSGHGLENPDATRWPLLYYCAQDGDPVDGAYCGYSLQDVHRQLKASGARMSLAVGSSCNAEPDSENPQRAQRYLDDLSEEMDRDQGEAQYNYDLFTTYRGHLLASSSLPGQLAYLNDRVGSYYVDALVNTTVKGLDTERAVSWASILRHTDEVVRKGWKKNQNAHFLESSGDVDRYSDPGQRFEGEAGDLQGFDADAYDEEWEAELDREEALELLPYVLIATLANQAPDRETFDYQLSEASGFYTRLLNDRYPFELDEDLWAYAVEDYEEDEEWFDEELAYASDLYGTLDQETQDAIEAFLQNLGH